MSQATGWSECGRGFDGQELSLIRQTVAGFPELCRSELVATVCEHLGWFTAAGTPKITACRRLLERLEGDGLIELPACVRGPRRPWAGVGPPPRRRRSIGPGCAGAWPMSPRSRWNR